MPAHPRKTSSDYIANQVFIGCQWKTVRPKYEKAINKLHKKFPVSFVIVGRTGEQDAEDLLKIIKEKLASSSYALFDATFGNANVSLEFGFAEAAEIDRAIYISSHGAAKKKVGEGSIIADLAGKRRNEYKQQSGLETLLAKLAKDHPYTRRFEKFFRARFGKASRGKKHRARTLALKVVHRLDDKPLLRRERIVQDLMADQVGYREKEVNDMIRRLHSAELIRSYPGRFSDVEIR